MKIISGIPTLARNTAIPIAKQLLTVSEHCYIIATDTRLDDVLVLGIHIQDGNYSLLQARNQIIDIAKRSEAEAVLQSDDDLKFDTSVLEAMLWQLSERQWLGAICSTPEMFFYWNRDFASNMGIKLVSSPTQLWMLRMQAIDEVGKFRLETMEDIDLGLRMWKAGWAVASIHFSKGQTHKPFIPRLKKSEGMGGQSISVRNKHMPEAIKLFNKEHVGNQLTSASLGKSNKHGSLTYHLRYNWEFMLKQVQDRWGEIGYIDNNGRRL